MVNAITFTFLVLSLFFLCVGLYVSKPKPNEPTDLLMANAKIAQIWMLASAAMLAAGFLFK